MNITEPILIFSVEKTELTDRENMVATAEVEDTLTSSDIPYNKVEGCFDGVTEQSFIVSANYEGRVKEYCQAFNQDSYLLIDANGTAALFTSEGKHITELGRLVKVSESEAKQQQAYTKVNEEYYVCK